MRENGVSQRRLRVGENVRHALAKFFLENRLNEPILDGIVLSISEVRMSPDLKIADVYLTALGRNNGQEIVEALKAHQRFIRGELAHELRQMKFMPQFRFFLDSSFDNYQKIENLLRLPQVAKDLEKGSGE